MLVRPELPCFNSSSKLGDKVHGGARVYQSAQRLPVSSVPDLLWGDKVLPANHLGLAQYWGGNICWVEPLEATLVMSTAVGIVTVFEQQLRKILPALLQL